MMRSLCTSTARAVDVNAKLATKAAAVLLRDVAAAGKGSSTATTEAPHLDVYVHVHDKSRATFLLHAQHIYGAVLTASPSLPVNVIPTLNEGLPACATIPDPKSDADVEALCAAASAAHVEPPTLFTRDTMEAERAAGFAPLYRFVAVGGTFDHLHSGHKLLLTTAALHASEKVHCGITDTALLTKKKFAERLQPIEVRKGCAEAFLRKIRPDLDLNVIAISDVSGGTDTIPDVEALTVSPETEKSLAVTNELRAKNGGLKPMVGIPIPFVTTPEGHIISSTELRQTLEKAG